MGRKEVAEIAGVSEASVSLALRGLPGVGELTRERIVRIARDLGYQPHGLASALAGSKVGLIGIIPCLAHNVIGPWDAMVMNGMAQVLSEAGMDWVVLSESTRQPIPRIMKRSLVDGAAFLIMPHKQVFEWSKERGIPCVAVHFDPGGDVDRVLADDEGGMILAVQHLISLGHRRIAYVATGPFVHQPSTDARLMGYLKAMGAAGLPSRTPDNDSLDVCEQAELFLSPDAPTAYVCYNDHTAMELIQYLHEKGVRVPEDVSVVGADDMYESRLFAPALTTVRVPFEEMGEKAAQILVARISDADLPCERVVLPERLVIRKSTGSPPED